MTAPTPEQFEALEFHVEKAQTEIGSLRGILSDVLDRLRELERWAVPVLQDPGWFNARSDAMDRMAERLLRLEQAADVLTGDLRGRPVVAHLEELRKRLHELERWTLAVEPYTRPAPEERRRTPLLRAAIEEAHAGYVPADLRRELELLAQTNPRGWGKRSGEALSRIAARADDGEGAP